MLKTAFVQPPLYPELKLYEKRMIIQEPEHVLNEPWWVTIIGCVTLAVLFAIALVAV